MLLGVAGRQQVPNDVCRGERPHVALAAAAADHGDHFAHPASAVLPAPAHAIQHIRLDPATADECHGAVGANDRLEPRGPLGEHLTVVVGQQVLRAEHQLE